MFDSPTPGARFAPPVPTADEPEPELELPGEPEETEMFGEEAYLERQEQKGQDERVYGQMAYAQKQESRVRGLSGGMHAP